jgi:glycosyltransferase involved in cell wall biosynthesis
MSALADLVVAIVIPCLNEKATLRDTCASLGFGLGDQIDLGNTYLLLIDNDSRDATLSIAKDVQKASPSGKVIVGFESERGYIPPRHCGAVLARKLAAQQGYSEENILLLQADADTLYSPGYIEAIRLASYTHGHNVLIEGYSEPPLILSTLYPQYLEMCRQIDSIFASLFPIKDDIIVDDKVCGYRLHDYFSWGGHQREFDVRGEEILAETTRMYMRARVIGGRKMWAEGALAYHSPRKILLEPALDMATAGFPRSVSWKTAWRQHYMGPTTLGEICATPQHPELQRALRIRLKHNIGLFALLPRHVAQARNAVPSVDAEIAGQILASTLPQRDTAVLSAHPGVLLTEILWLIDEMGDELIEMASIALQEHH